MMERKTQSVLGYYVDLITFKEAVNLLVEKIKNKEGTHVITINPEIIELAKNNPQTDTIIKNAELVVADGTGIQLALKFKGIYQQRIPGVDLAFELIKKCNEHNFPIALIGAKEEVISQACKNLKEQFPNVNICYSRNGYFSNDEENEIINDITNASPAVIMAALGAPKQEIFIQKLRQQLPNAVYIGLGGSFDVWAGAVERAPEIYRKLGCEWLYRTLKQPERIKRIYKTLPLFLFKAIIESACMCKKGNK